MAVPRVFTMRNDYTQTGGIGDWIFPICDAPRENEEIGDWQMPLAKKLK